MMRMEEGRERVAQSQPVDYAVLEVGDRLVEVDADSYLVNPADWSREVCERMAELDDLELGDDHWLLVDFLHRFYSEFALAPEMPVLARNLCKDQHDCRWTRRYIRQLFPGGAKTACRYAGLPAPVGRSCG